MMKILKVFCFLIPILLASCAQPKESLYEDFDALVKSNDISQGYVPVIIPGDAKEIKAFHLGDRAYGQFAFTKDYYSCLELDPASIDMVINEMPTDKELQKPAWFPSAEELKKRDLEYYAFKDFHLIVDHEGKRGYFLK